MFSSLGDKFGTAIGTYFLGLVKHQLGELEEALKLAHDSLDMNMEIGEKQRIIASRLLVATLMDEDGKHSEAEAIFGELLEEATEMKDMEGMVAIGQALASNFVAQGKLDEARKLLDKSLELARQSNMTSYEASGLHIIANHNVKMGNLEDAVELFKKSSGIFESIAASTEQARVLLSWGKALKASGSDDDGRIARALEVFEKHGMKALASEAREALK
jgi:tetratricopeptide (TPR) repeat protein